MVAFFGLHMKVDRFFLVMELVSGGNALDAALRGELSCSGKDPVWLLRDISAGLSFLSQQGVVHSEYVCQCAPWLCVG
jgi:serine/threonine protein kinase